MATLSQENYLKALWHLAGEGKVTLQRLASQLGVRPASVLAMVRKLEDAKLVAYDRRAGIRLTDRGRREAVDIVRRHRLWEVFLHDKLGYRWDQVHRIAEELEHIAIPDLTDRLAAFLENPCYDPHGDPIPQKDGTLPPRSELVLAQQPPGSYRIVGFKSTADPLLQQIEHFRLTLGQTVVLQEKLPYDDTLVLRVGSRTIHLGVQVAEQILVTPEK